MTGSHKDNLEILTWIGTSFILLVFLWSLFTFFTSDSEGMVLLVLGSCLLSLTAFAISCVNAFVHENRRFLIAAFISLLPPISVLSLIFFVAWMATDG